MLSFKDIVLTSALLAVARGHGVILGAQGTAGSPPSVGFKVDPALARNCTTINPCQQDATLIRDAEINANIVNECGRTELSGNIDVGENTENAISAGKVTKVTAGSDLTVTIHQVNADGAGPYACDLDPTGNSLGSTGQIPLQVTNNVPGVNGFSQAKAAQFNITVKLPSDLACTGASSGNVCTVRCRNNAVAGPFGGCFAVQQTDVKQTKNVANKINSLKDLKTVLAQAQGNNADLPEAIKANQVDGSATGKANLEAAEKLTGVEAPVIKNFPSENTGPGAASADGGNNTNSPKAAPKGAPLADATIPSNGAGAATGNGGKAKAAPLADATIPSKGNNGNNQKKGGNNNKRDEDGARSLRWAKRNGEEVEAEEESDE